MREIARRAGYTPGAIYSYFASREEVYAALLGESLAAPRRAGRRRTR
jgi:AcrR family transcriptional regulator